MKNFKKMFANRNKYYIVVLTNNIKRDYKTVDVEYFKRVFSDVILQAEEIWAIGTGGVF